MKQYRTDKIRVLHVMGHMTRAGAETLLMHVLRNIDRDRFKCDVVVHTTEPGAYDDEIRALGGKVMPCLSPSRPRSYARNLTAILNDHGPYDVVHSHIHHYSGFVLHLAQQSGVPARVVHSHKGKAATSVTLPRRVYLSLARRLIDRHATAGLAVSRSAAEDLFGSGWERDPRWRILRIGIDLSPFAQPVDRRAVRAELGLGQDDVVIGHVGRLAPEKNHRLLLSVAAQMVRRNPRTRLLLVGDGPLREEIEAEAKDAGLLSHTIFAGMRDDTARLMMGAVDVVVHPSFYEGLPLALVEAQAAGVPCVVSDVIGDEMDVVDALVRRVSLRASPETWADVVAAALESRLTVSPADALAAAQAGPLNIANSIRELEAFYSTVCLPGRAQAGAMNLGEVAG